MKAVFDNSAEGYDAEFTHTPIGQLQRNYVWSYLEKILPTLPSKNILEVNCGTGEDAIFLARHGCKVMATDVSKKMIAVATGKITAAGLKESITCLELDLTALTTIETKERYGAILSNFGGLNCVDPFQLKNFIDKASEFLLPGGRLVLVLMSKFCSWETLYYISKLKAKKAFRRLTNKPVRAAVEKSEFNIWYYNPSHIKKLASHQFACIHIQPIGITVPPSYMNHTFSNHQKTLKKLDAIENKLNKFKVLSNFSDHYLIDLKLR
jgi:ubiquinone/menaquinone biosynthesis C-methylase UbiE